MIVVLGCGPAGLMAAEAARQSTGQIIKIISIKKPSPIMGAQYVHKEIPSITHDPDGEIHYKYVGDAEGYAKKVYGSSEAPTSWMKFVDSPYWSMQGVYATLWDRWQAIIENQEVDYNTVSDILGDVHVRLVISSVPLRVICPEPERYSWYAEQVRIREGSSADPDTIVYNGRLEDHWYRSSNICGYKFTEYPLEQELLDGGYIIKKPLRSTYDPGTVGGRLLCVGRYGKWEKQSLAHEAFTDTMDRTEELHL